MTNWVSNMFSGGAEAGAAGAGDILREAGEGIGEGFNPYEHEGVNALHHYFRGSRAMRNPYEFFQRMMEHYQESPQAKHAIAEGIKSANAAGAASGMLGSGAEKKALQRQGQQIVGEDQQNWLNNMMRIYGGYLGGMHGIAGMGLSAQDAAAQERERLAEARAQAEMARQQAKAQGEGGILGAAGSLLGHFGHYLT